jgi:hypothetical protein
MQPFLERGPNPDVVYIREQRPVGREVGVEGARAGCWIQLASDPSNGVELEVPLKAVQRQMRGSRRQIQRGLKV